MANVLSTFDNDCHIKTSVISKRYKFLTRRQAPGDCCDNFVTQLRSLCALCEYANPEKALRDQFVLQLRDERHREKLLHQAQIDANTEESLRDQFKLQLRDERHREKLFDHSQIVVNTLTFAKSISMVKIFEATIEHPKQRKKNLINSLMCSNCEWRELLNENVPSVGEITNLKIVLHLERHATSVKEKITSATCATRKMIGST